MSLWQERKGQHLALSDAAAEKYDEFYSGANFATGSYMLFENEIINRSLKLARSKGLALDLGCGTGRHSFLLARHFDQVFGYDFSEGMLGVAERNKIKHRSGNSLFQRLDVEQERLPVADGAVSLVNTGFGMGSFLESPERLFREVRRVLQPSGIAIFSFYNRDALVNRLNLTWTPALAARARPETDTLDVNFEGVCYEIPAKAYSVPDIRARLEGNFIIHELTTFPVLSALFPQELFANEDAKKLCTQVDNLLARNIELAAGPYIVAVCIKKGFYEPPEPHGLARVIKLLHQYNLHHDIIEHEPVHTMEDVKRVVSADPEQMVKSVLVAVDGKNSHTLQNPNADLCLAAVPAPRKLDLAKLARFLNVPYKKIRLATQEEVEDITGFKIGSIPPFGLPRHAIVILDSSFSRFQHVWCGTGRCTESLKISIEDLRRISSASLGDISKDRNNPA
jgi:prolyl-tRNA editing enzyme YbaK/EbsC (Cys-tRNA(Pro) deacylase)/SAM-dependent methyltransferase